jgi:hypothetical protein
VLAAASGAGLAALFDIPSYRVLAAEEQSIAVLKEYLSADLQKALQDAKANLDAVTLNQYCRSGERPADVRDRASAVNEARRKLGLLLDQLLSSFLGNGSLSEIYDLIMRRQFRRALQKIEGLAPLPIVWMPEAQIAQALTRTNLEYECGHWTTCRPRERNCRPEWVSFISTLPGYGGPELTNIAYLLMLRDLVAGGTELGFQKGLLHAVCHVGLGDFDQALLVFNNLLSLDDLSELQRRFLFVRQGQAILAQGDRTFRKAEDRGARDVAKKKYQAAKALMASSSLPETSPERLKIERYADSQLAKIEANLNVLGLRDSFVPVQRHTFLEALANDQIQKAKTAAQRFMDFHGIVDNLERTENQLRSDLRIADASVSIAEGRVNTADLRLEAQRVRIAAISDHETFLKAEFVAGGMGSLPMAVANLAGSEVGPAAASVSGLVSSVVDFFAQRQELQHQMRVAEIESKITELERAAAELEVSIAEIKRKFINDSLDAIVAGRLNRNLYTELANIYEDLARSHLDEAIRLSYLYERAVAFFLGRPEIRFVKFAYETPLPDSDSFIPAPDLLDLDLDAIKAQFTQPTSVQFDALVENPIWLKSKYPVEFARFRQTGVMDFSIPLYDIDKLRPGIYHYRILDVSVTIRATVPITGFTGTLTHHGSFLIRDRASSLDPATSRLIPTKDEVDKALERQQQGEPTAAIAGVLPYALDKDTRELSAATERVRTDKQQIFTIPLEGYGPAGLWTLRIDSGDFRKIDQVDLTFTIEYAERDDALQTKIKSLVKQYEAEAAGRDALDQITAIYMKDNFQEDFLELEGGSSQIILAEESLPTSFRTRAHFQTPITDLKVKAVFLQIVDHNMRGMEGVEITVAKEGSTFSISRTTGPGGFTENVEASLPVLEPAGRFPVTGKWRIRLSNPSQFDKNGNVIWFFLYEFREV